MQYMFQSDWFLYNLSLHVGVMDVYNLKMVSKMTWRNMIIRERDILNIIVKKVHIRLKEVLRTHYDLFIKYIKMNQIALSGSFVMQCILGEFWDDSDIDLYLGDNDNYFDVLSIDKEILTFEQKKQIDDSYHHIVDITRIINRKVFGQRIQTIKICGKSYDGIKNFVLGFDLDICKNIFTYIDGKEVVYVHNLNKLINRWDEFNGNFLRGRMRERIEKYIGRGFDIQGKLTIDKYFKYSAQRMPFLVFKNDKDGKFEKLTFLDRILNRDDIIRYLNERNGKFIISIDENKCERMGNDRWVFGIYLGELFKIFLNGLCWESDKCDCHVDDLCGIRHKHWRLNCCWIHNKSILQFLVVNYDDLDGIMKDEYDKIFDMDDAIEEKHIDIGFEHVYRDFWAKYWDMFDLGDIVVQDDEYDVLEKINIKFHYEVNELSARISERGPVDGRYYNDKHNFNYDFRVRNTWYNKKRKLLKDIGDDDLIVINGVKYQKKGFIVGNLGYLDVGVCYKVMDVMIKKIES